MNHVGLETAIKETLDFFETEYGQEGIDANLNAYITNKSFLVDMLRKHPAWNEDAHALVFAVNEKREVTPNHELVEMFWELVSLLPESSALKLASSIPFSILCEEATASAFTAKAINNSFPDIRASAGQKVSRLVNKLMLHLGAEGNSDAYKRSFAKFADAINPFTIERPFILSANPGDYLSMSYGTNWSSCHIINPNMSRGGSNYSGCYRLGTLSYMNDPCSLVAYTLEKLPEDIRDITTTPKLTRQMFMIDFNKPAILQSRLYPYTDDDDRRKDYRNIVQAAVAKILDIPNLWVKKSGALGFYTADPSYHYRDYNNLSWYPNTSVLKGAETDAEYWDRAMPIGNETYCLNTGEAMCGRESDSLYIDGDDVHQCWCCEESHHENDMTYIEGYGWVCASCLDNEFYECSDCGNYVYCEDIYHAYRNDYEVDLCRDCFDSNYYICDCCDEGYHYRNVHTDVYNEHGNVISVCNECFDEKCFVCDECGAEFTNGCLHMINGRFVCGSCHEELVNENNDEEVA